MRIYLDFETRCELDLKSVGLQRYIEHESFDVLCLAYTIDELSVKVIKGPSFSKNWVEESKELRRLARFQNDGVEIEAHNANFEMRIWNTFMVRKGFAPIDIHRWRDSAAVAAYKSMPRALGALAEALKLEHQKDKEGRIVMMKMCKKKDGVWHEDEADFQKLMSYCADDVRAERACSHYLGDLPEQELKVWQLDSEINQRGIPVDTKLCESALRETSKVKDALAKEMFDLAQCKPSQVQVMQDKFAERGVEVSDLRSETMKLMMLEPNLPEEVKTMMRIRRDYATTSLKKYEVALNMVNADGRIRDQFMYHGAGTGRWTGKGLQFHNLPRGTLNEHTAKDDMETICHLLKEGCVEDAENLYGMSGTDVLKSALRGIVRAEPGHVLRVMDYSQIEARVLPWLAGQESTLDAFRAGKDLYKFTASQIYNKAYEDITKSERFIGKVASLALGYQGGARAFTKFAINYGTYVDEALAEKIKSDWRQKNSAIVRFWYNLELAAISAVEAKGKQVFTVGHIQFAVQGDYLAMRLPSGRCLWYHKPEIEFDDKFGKNRIKYTGINHENKWGPCTLYGGLLAENATQAVARDILVDAMLFLEQSGFKVILHVHDEIVIHDQIGNGSLAFMKKVMTTGPEWAEGLPIEAAGFETQRYYKG